MKTNEVILQMHPLSCHLALLLRRAPPGSLGSDAGWGLWGERWLSWTFHQGHFLVWPRLEAWRFFLFPGIVGWFFLFSEFRFFHNGKIGTKIHRMVSGGGQLAVGKCWENDIEVRLRCGWGTVESVIYVWVSVEYAVSIRWVPVKPQLSVGWAYAEPQLRFAFFLWVTVEVFYGLRSGWGKSAYSKPPQSIVFMVWVGFEWILSRFEFISWNLKSYSNSLGATSNLLKFNRFFFREKKRKFPQNQLKTNSISLKYIFWWDFTQMVTQKNKFHNLSGFNINSTSIPAW